MNQYQFNVSHNGKHLFRTDWYDIQEDAVRIAAALSAKFPASEGFAITQLKRPMSMTASQVPN